jgi:uncharacterized membrane protein
MFNASHIHPMVVHFPIALIMVAFLADFLGLFIKKEKCLSVMGFYLLILGTLAAIVAWSTGYFFTSEMDGEPGKARELHELFATLTLISVIITLVFRFVIFRFKLINIRFKYGYMLLFFCAFILVSITGYLGGDLVMTYLLGM